jgi:hypothetical protein
MHTHTLELYTHADTDIPMSMITVDLGRNRAEKRAIKRMLAKVGHAYIRVSENTELFNIRNGTNPRGLNKESAKVKAIRKTLENLPGFAVYNGGVCVVIDDDSFSHHEEDGTISFSCEQDGSGHYDGQHTIEGVRQGAPLAENQQVSITFVENRFFVDNKQIRTAAETWNSRETQKLHSEQNQRGVFDDLKKYIAASYASNIGWREHERNVEGEIIKKECRIDRVISLLYTAVPALRGEVLDTGDDMYNILRKGYRAAMLLEDDEKSADFKRLYEHTNLILGLNDYVQKNLRSAYVKNADAGESFDGLQVVRKSGKSDMNKPVAKRKFFAQQLFDGTSAPEALLPDYMQPIMYGFLKNILKPDRTNGNVIVANGYSVHDLQRIWDAAGYEILAMLEKRFTKYFTKRFNSRHAEFGCWSNLWDKCDHIFEDVIDQGSWKMTSAAAK